MGISTHILDVALGRSAAKVVVRLALLRGAEWVEIQDAATDADGRVKHLLPAEQALVPGRYRARFETAAYYEAQGVAGLYPYIDVVFEVRPDEVHYHVPLLLTANGYTTYRGS